MRMSVMQENVNATWAADETTSALSRAALPNTVAPFRNSEAGPGVSLLVTKHLLELY